ncbi:MAG: hypothetical protein ILP09_09135, partial [Oscillospiraceae bacterium]|nr:hypothetical protein [Oscillospiraceae bacterium]
NDHDNRNTGASALNAEFACPTEPCFALSEHIELRSREDIEALCGVIGVRDGQEAARWLLEPENLKMILLAIPKADFLLFRRAAGETFINDEGVVLPRHRSALMFCLMTAFKTRRGIFITVPTEIKRLWSDLDRLGFGEYKLKRDELDAFAAACAKLYGALTLDELCEIFALRSEYGSITKQQALSMLEGLDDGQGYVIEDGYVLHPTARPELAGDYISVRAGIERYLPDREKLERLGEGDYYDIFRELELYRLSVEDSMGESRAMAMVDSLYMLLASELYGPFVRRDFFEWFGLEEDRQLTEKLKRKVRQWRLYGHTAEELEKKR